MHYHQKMGKLLAKEGNVTKVPVHTCGESHKLNNLCYIRADKNLTLLKHTSAKASKRSIRNVVKKIRNDRKS